MNTPNTNVIVAKAIASSFNFLQIIAHSPNTPINNAKKE
jgi:hypothetical protein